MLVAPHNFFGTALNMQYVIGAFNASNLEFVQAIVSAGINQKSPVIVQTSEGAIEYAGIGALSAIVKEVSEKLDWPVILHLDHGKSLEMAISCIEHGYTSVMIDASKEDFMNNVRLTKEVVDYAHDRGVWVEAELGGMLGQEGAQALHGEKLPITMLTDPTEVKRFVTMTGVDALAVAVGTIHGAFTGQEYIRFELLKKIQEEVPKLPLVIHGGSGLSDVHLEEVAITNVCKVNVDTELRIVFEQAIKGFLGEPHNQIDPRDMLGAGREAVAALVEKKIALFGSANKAHL